MYASRMLSVLLAATLAAHAQTPYPTRAIRMVVPLPAGSSTYLEARAYAEALSEQWKKPVYLDIKKGAGGMLAARDVLVASPDGYTVGLLIRGMLTKGAAYDPLAFVYATMLSEPGLFLVVPTSSPVTSVAELIGSSPRSYAAASPGAQDAGRQFTDTTGLGAVEVSNYKESGEREALLDVMRGLVQFGFFFAANTRVGIDNHWIRPLATIARARSEFLPDIPTIGEALTQAGAHTYEPVAPYMGAIFPPNTSRDIAETFARMACTASRQAALVATFKNIWSRALCSTPEEFRALAERTLAAQD